MNCCSDCFKDFEIKSIIKSKGNKGNCDFCGSKNIFVYDIIENEEIKEKFEELLNLYTTEEEMKIYPSEKSELLKNILFSQWNIFNLNAEEIYKFLKNLLPEKYENNPCLFNQTVGLKRSTDIDYIGKNSILKKFQWKDFIEEIKFKNRFHSDILNKEIFRIILERNVKSYKNGAKFYRARISNNKGFSKEEMGAPPPEKISGGRVNSQGIHCLYLADSEKTTIHEVRAGLYDYVTIAEFELLKDIKVINLTEIDKNSPFQTDNMEMLAINLFHLKEIANEISKPLRKNVDSLEYLPTQYISDFIKKEGFDGIEYKSVMNKEGNNLAIFDEKLFHCTNIKTHFINNLYYGY